MPCQDTHTQSVTKKVIRIADGGLSNFLFFLLFRGNTDGPAALTVRFFRLSAPIPYTSCYLAPNLIISNNSFWAILSHTFGRHPQSTQWVCDKRNAVQRTNPFKEKKKKNGNKCIQIKKRQYWWRLEVQMDWEFKKNLGDEYSSRELTRWNQRVTKRWTEGNCVFFLRFVLLWTRLVIISTSSFMLNYDEFNASLKKIEENKRNVLHAKK